VRLDSVGCSAVKIKLLTMLGGVFLIALLFAGCGSPTYHHVSQHEVEATQPVKL